MPSSTSVSIQDFVKSASHTAYHFGFSPLDRLRAHPACKTCDTRIEHHANAQSRKNDSLHGMLTQGMCAYFDYKLHAIEGPSLFYTIDQVPRTGEVAVTFHVLNVRKSIAEALLIQTIRSFLADLGYARQLVRINSIGDSDSISRYIRDLTNFLRKRLDEMPPQARELMKEHPIAALLHLIEKEHDIAKKSPNPLEYLTDSSRKHFREIVEYLDMSETPFEIDPRLIGHHECYSDALFAFDVIGENDERDLGAPFTIRGGRYSNFVSKMTRTKIPAAGAVVILKDKKAPAHIPAPRVRYTPSVYLVQLGFGPKVKSLLLIDELRRAGISVFQNIMSDSLSEQLRLAEAKNARYAIILGHKEFMDGNVILRDLTQQSQEYLPMASLASYLKKVA
ncbi:MAG TPA: His/Gly/Thr/Pro-type tRNA ligase C-terminal domain-containing protein [Candidatus Paceibacterota bacterium]|nr:His/Gly/Thr/Pro-type tRNA ligase C-terminal domain-containing protein [Candidatus Paceibacterota bacterium]